MRYRIGEDVQNLGEPVVDGLVPFSAVLGLLMGIGFVVAGIRAKQIWLTFWGAGLVISSVLYLGADILGFV